MKQINNYIQEKLRVDKEFGNKKVFFPANKEELDKLLKRLIPERGNNADLNDIDVSKITDMSYLFTAFKDIEQIDISKWDVSNVHTTRYMFPKCTKFNCDLSKWNVSKLEDARAMFSYCKSFDCDLSGWNTSRIDDMECMFEGCESFRGKGLRNWDVSNVEYMDHTFAYCDNFDEDLSEWDTRNLIDLSCTFKECKKLSCDFHTWNVSLVKYHSQTFDGCPLVKNKPMWVL